MVPGTVPGTVPSTVLTRLKKYVNLSLTNYTYSDILLIVLALKPSEC